MCYVGLHAYSLMFVQMQSKTILNRIFPIAFELKKGAHEHNIFIIMPLYGQCLLQVRKVERKSKLRNNDNSSTTLTSTIFHYIVTTFLQPQLVAIGNSVKYFTLLHILLLGYHLFGRPIHFTVSCANLAQVVFKMFPVSLAPMFFVCPTGTVLLHRGIFIVSSTCCRFFYLFNKSHVVCGIFQFDIFFPFATVVTFSTAEKHFTTN